MKVMSEFAITCSSRSMPVGLAEVGRSVAGPHGMRLTNAGHDFIEVARDDARWRAAKVVVIEETGGQSLAMMRALLTKWAWRTVVRSERQLRPRRRSYRYVESAAPAWWARAEYPDADFPIDDTTTRLVRRRARIASTSVHGPFGTTIFTVTWPKNSKSVDRVRRCRLTLSKNRCFDRLAVG